MVGLLALQGDYSAHGERLRGLGLKTQEVRQAADLSNVTALIVPGGESSVLLKLLEPSLEQALIATVRAGTPTLATCAGLILIAEEVKNPEQRSLGLLNIGVARNAYGRQIDSFINEKTEFTSIGRETLKQQDVQIREPFESVFIRAPKIEWAGKKAESLAEVGGAPILIRQDNILGATFHPELSQSTDSIYELLFSLRRNSA